jgi:hypothetical protein
MPWKECHVMDERVRFVARLLDGEKRPCPIMLSLLSVTRLVCGSIHTSQK